MGLLQGQGTGRNKTGATIQESKGKEAYEENERTMETQGLKYTPEDLIIIIVPGDFSRYSRFCLLLFTHWQ